MEDLLKIYSFSDSERKVELGVFECFVSPLSVKIHQQNTYGSLQGINSSLPLTAFACGGRNTMEVSIILDGTGAYASHDDEPIDVITQLNDLMSNTMLYDGSIHQPPFLKVIWGTTPVFLCRGESLDVDYKTFNNEGVPVRADITLLLVEDVNIELSKRQANKESPDLFHEHLVRNNENLATISYQYYQDTSHLHLIANQNDMNNLYACIPGKVLLIPPLTEPVYE